MGVRGGAGPPRTSRDVPINHLDQWYASAVASVIWRSQPGENVQVPLPGTYISVDELLSKPIAFLAPSWTSILPQFEPHTPSPYRTPPVMSSQPRVCVAATAGRQCG